MVVVFDLGTGGDAIADVGEQTLDTLQGAGDRVQATGGLAPPGQGHVDAFCGEASGQCGLLQRRLAAVDCVLDTFLGGVDQRASLGTLLSGEVAQGLHDLGQLTLLAQVIDPELFQGIGVFGVPHGLQCLGDQRIQVFHLGTPDTK